MAGLYFAWAIFFVFPCTCNAKPIFRKHVLDMSYVLDNETFFWPTGQLATFNLTMTSKSLAGSDVIYSGGNYMAGEHGGTHIDSPFHFNFNGQTIEQIPIESLQPEAIVVDVRKQVKADREYQVSLEDFQQWENKHGKMPLKALFIICTGWEELWPNKTAILGSEDLTDPTTFTFPGMTPELADFLIRERQLGGIAIDTPSPDGSKTLATLEVHIMTAPLNIYIIENLKGACDIPQRGVTLLISPMKIGGGSGAPARIFATWGDEVDERKPDCDPESSGAPLLSFSNFLLVTSWTLFFQLFDHLYTGYSTDNSSIAAG